MPRPTCRRTPRWDAPVWGKSRPSARLCSVYYTAVFRIYLGHRRDHLSSSGQKELSGLGMCCYVARLERCDIVMLQPAPP